MPEITTIVTKRDDGVPNNTLAETPSTIPDVIVKALSPARITVTRVLRVYLQSLAGMLTVVMSGMAPDALIPPADFVSKLQLAAGLAIAPATMALLQNAVELLTKFDESHPQLRA